MVMFRFGRKVPAEIKRGILCLQMALAAGID